MNTKITISILSLLIIMNNVIGNDNKQDVTAPISLSEIKKELIDIQEQKKVNQKKLEEIVRQIAEGKQNAEDFILKAEDFILTERCKQLRHDEKQMEDELTYLRMKESALHGVVDVNEKESWGNHIIAITAKGIEKGLYYSDSGKCKNIVCQAIRDKVAGEFRARINNARITEIAEIEQKIQVRKIELDAARTKTNLIIAQWAHSDQHDEKLIKERHSAINKEDRYQKELIDMELDLQQLSQQIPTRINQSAVKCGLEIAQIKSMLATKVRDEQLHFLLTDTEEGKEYAQAEKEYYQAKESKAALERFKQADKQLRETQQYKEVFEPREKEFLYWDFREHGLEKMNRYAILKGYDGKSEIEAMYSGLNSALGIDTRCNDDLCRQVRNQVKTELTALIEQLRVDAGIEEFELPILIRVAD